MNEEIVDRGMAWHCTPKSKDKMLAEKEAKAREEKFKLWADESPIAPWEWRAMEIKKAARKSGR